MDYYKVILSYKGTAYSGWQYQTENPNTVQSEVEKVLASIVNHQDFKLMAASRTDTGVHARGQVLKLALPKKIDPAKLTMGMNSKLPSDIKVVSIDFASKNFNSNQDVLSKEYHYYFSTSKKTNAALSDIIYFIPEDLDIKLMNTACNLLIGIHDFENFCAKGSREVSLKRDIQECCILQTSFEPLESEIYYLKIKANGFLKYMVRYLMGAILKVGSKELSLEDFNKLLENSITKVKKDKAPAHGLHLIEINYEDLSR